MVELKGLEEPLGGRREKGVEHEIIKGRRSWLERKTEADAALGDVEQPYVVIVGGGQGGIGLGARLKRHGIPTVILEKNDRAGDSWRKRYKSLHLHDPVWYDHLPYLKFPDHWPVFAAKDKLGDWLEHYVALMELNYWTRSECRNARWDQEAEEWVVTVDRDGTDVELRPKQLVIALGVSGYPNRPTYAGQDVFRGEQHHSSDFPGGDAYADKNVVVIGSNNSAFDICAAVWEAGGHPTMVQRSSTHLIRSESLMDLALGDLYSERAVASGVTTERADLIFASLPYRIMAGAVKPAYDEAQVRDKEYYDGLRAAGFDLDFGVDDSGLFMKYLRRGSGYYIDVGAGQLVIDGRVPVAHGQVDHLTEDAVVLDDGTSLPADVVVYATGYQSMNGFLETLISTEVADQVGKVWGYGSDTPKDPGPWEGELRNMWKPTNVDEPLDPRRQPAPVAALLAVPRVAAAGAVRGPRHPRLRAAGVAPPAVAEWPRSHDLSVRPATLRLMEVLVALAGLLLGALLTWLGVRSRYAVRLATASAERDLLRERVIDLEATLSEDSETAQMIAPLRSSLDRVERQVHDLERERVAQFSEVAAEMARVSRTTTELGAQTASLVGSLNASSVRGMWGEVQLRRVLEHAGMLARCDFEEQVTGTGADDRRVRPDVVVRLPGDKCLVVDAKVPMTAFLAAQREGITAAERTGRLTAHAKALRGHVDSLAGKAYWSAFETTPEMVVCFVPGEAILTAALAHDPELHEYAMARRVVLASPATLLALLRTVAFTWQQDALSHNARELLTVGRELHDRLGSLGAHTQTMGAALRRSVEAYNGFVGSLEHRVLPTARRMRDLGVVERDIERLVPLDATPRPLTAFELVGGGPADEEPDASRHTPAGDLAALDAEVARAELDLEPGHGRSPDERSARDGGARSA